MLYSILIEVCMVVCLYLRCQDCNYSFKNMFYNLYM